MFKASTLRRSTAIGGALALLAGCNEDGSDFDVRSQIGPDPQPFGVAWIDHTL